MHHRIKELRHALPDQSHILIWELSQRPLFTITEVTTALQHFNYLQKLTTKVNAVVTREVTELKAQVEEFKEAITVITHIPDYSPTTAISETPSPPQPVEPALPQGGPYQLHSQINEKSHLLPVRKARTLCKAM